jgi:hypothetical protein
VLTIALKQILDQTMQMDISKQAMMLFSADPQIPSDS